MWFPAPGKLAVNQPFGNVGVPLTPMRPGLLGSLFHPITARQAASARSAAARSAAMSGPAERTSRE